MQKILFGIISCIFFYSCSTQIKVIQPAELPSPIEETLEFKEQPSEPLKVIQPKSIEGTLEFKGQPLEPVKAIPAMSFEEFLEFKEQPSASVPNSEIKEQPSTPVPDPEVNKIIKEILCREGRLSSDECE